MKIRFTLTGSMDIAEDAYEPGTTDEEIVELEKSAILDGDIPIYDISDLDVKISIERP